MLKLNSLVVCATFLSLGLAQAASAAGPTLVQAPIEKVFVPQGFDDNDKVEVIVHGHFTNSCYKMGPVDATVDNAAKKIVITAAAYYYPGAVCAQMMIPFIKSVEFKGILAAGKYTISVANRPTAKTSPLSITRATRPEADDYLYAAVQSVNIDEKSDGTRSLVLKGQHPYLLQGCIKLQEVKTYLSPGGVLVVQPITRIENESEQCRGAVNNRFEYHTPLTTPLAQGEYVIHVRALDGNSVNQFFIEN